MGTKEVHLIDGPAAGTKLVIQDDQPVLSIAYLDEDDVNYPAVGMHECDLERWQPKRIDYQIAFYAASKILPYRVKVLWVGAVDEPPKYLPLWLEEDFWRQPWELFKATSFLDNFDQWFAESVHRNMGLITWKGEVVRDV